MWSLKRQLASRLTEILGSYCQGIDIHGVEANLLTDTLTLDHVCINPRQGISGSIDSIVFAWEWGAGDLASLGVRACTLEVRGVKIKATLPTATCHAERSPPCHSEGRNECDQEGEDANSSSSMWETFLDECVQHLVDKLNIRLFDVEVQVEDTLVVSFDSLDLDSFGKDDTSLSQRISLEGLSLYCLSEGAKSKLVEPFSYSAGVRRVTGKRFHSFTSGLEIIGDEPACAFKLNTDSLRALLPLLKKLNDQPSSPSEAHQNESSTWSTRFVLPLPDFVVTLPNDARATLHSTRLSFSMNGSEFLFSGSRGLSCNGWPVVRFSEGSVWCLDMIRHSFCIVRDGFVDAVSNEEVVEDPLVSIEWCEIWGLKLLKGALELQELLSTFTAAIAAPGETREDSPKEDSVFWNMALSGAASVCLTSSDGKWLRVLCDNPTLDASASTVRVAQAGKMVVSSFAGTNVLIPGPRFVPNFGIVADEIVSCRLESFASLSDVADFATSMAEMVLDLTCTDSTESRPQGDDTGIASFPFSLKLQQVSLIVRKEEIDVTLDGVEVNESENNLRLSHCNFSDGSGTILSASDFLVSLNQHCCQVEVSRIESLYIPGVASITTPIKSVVVKTLLDGAIKVEIPSVCLLLLESSQDSGKKTQPPLIPFPVSISLSQMSIESNSKRLAIIQGVWAELESNGGLMFACGYGTCESSMVHLKNSSVSGVLGMETVYNLKVRPGHMEITAELSSFDWSLLVPGGDRNSKQTVWNLPHVLIDTYTMQISIQKGSLSTGKPHRMAAYQGGPGTTSADISDYIIKLCLNEFPHLYTKTTVLGERATDLTAKAAGRFAGSTLAGSVFGPIGSVCALVVVDSVKGVVSLGRKGRVDLDEKKIKSRDFVTGVWRATKAAAFKGGQLRRGVAVQYRYEFGDVAYGASRALSSYLDKNSERFGSAAFSAVGVVCGGAIYGFGGMMFGNIVGGKAGALLFKQKPKASSEQVADGEYQYRVECAETDDWLVIQHGENENDDEGDCESLGSDGDDGILLANSLDAREAQEKAAPIYHAENAPSPSAPSVTTGEGFIMDLAGLKPAQEALLKGSYQEEVKRKARELLGLGPSSKKTWVKS